MRPASVVLLAFFCVASLQADDQANAAQRVGRLRSQAVVPSRDFATIQAAIDAVGDGGSILVKPGTYREQLTIDGKRIRLSGSGSDGARRTEIAGAASTEVDDHTRAAGLVNYVNGGGGVIEGIALRGGLNGIVGRGPAALRDLATPALANALTVRDVAISSTGRAILWHAPANLAIRGLRARHLRHNGIVFAPDSGERLGGASFSVQDADIFQPAGYGVLVLDTASIGCQNQLSNVNITLAEAGGIGVIRSGVCITGGVLTLNRVAGIYLEQSTAVIDGTSVQSSIATGGGLWGAGILSVGSDLTLSNAFLNLNALTAVSNLGGLATLSWNTLNCNAIDLNGETLTAGYLGPSQPPADVAYEFHNPIPGSNTCGCGGVQVACAVKTTDLHPPAPVVSP